MLVIPPFFTDSSHCLTLQVSNNTLAFVTCAAPSQPTESRFAESTFGVKLGDVFAASFPRTSHQPVTFCSFHLLLLLPVKAYSISITRIIDTVRGICQPYFCQKADVLLYKIPQYFQ